MKTTLLFLLITLSFTVLSFGQNTYVPDDNFEQALIDLGYDTPPLNNYVPTANIDHIVSLSVSDKNISDLTGIEDFVALRGLLCSGNQLTNIDLSNVDQPFLTLFCSNNQLTSLDISNCTFLRQLQCDNNQISNLDLSQNTNLLELFCSNNPLNNLDISSNILLKYLICQNNQLTSLDVSNNNELRQLACPNNQLLSLDISNLTLLTSLYIGYNQFTSIDLSNNTALTYFACNENLISNIDVSNNTSLGGLDCSHNNNITGLDLINNPQLYLLRCNNCSLTSLDISIHTALQELHCSDNQITNLDVSNNVNLNRFFCEYNQIASLYLTNNTALRYFRCTNNQLTSLDVSHNTLLYEFNCSFNFITNLDVSNNPSLYFLFVHSNQLISFNVKNGNNINLGEFYAVNNPNLTCIQVDNAAWSYANWPAKPPTAIYSVNCSSLPISVTSPNGGEIWATGSVHNISWSEGSGTNTKIELWNSATNLKVSDIASNIVGQTYSWTIGATANGSTYKIKVIDNGDGSTDLSNADFRITQPIALTAPNGGEIWATGSVHNISWSEGSGTNTTIELWNSATNLKVSDIASNVVGQSYSWTIGATANSSTYKIKVIDNGDGSTDMSNANFRITQPIAVTSPNGAEIWRTGSVYNITWTEGSGTNTTIELWNSATNLKVSDITSNIVGQTYSWTIGATANGSTYKIKVIDNGDGSTDMSNANFRITQPIAVTSPNGGEIWVTGSVQNINWTEGSGTNTTIELWNSATNLKVSDIASNIVGQTYSWNLGATAIGSTYKIKVIDNGDGSTDLSNTDFIITESVVLTTPNGGEIWATGSIHTISWVVGSGTNTTIELWNSATNLKVSDIASNIVGQAYTWTVGAIANGSTYKIKVIDNGDGSTDMSNADFRITQPIALTSPNGGEIWATGSVHNITWLEGSGTNTNIELWNSATNLKVSDIASNIVGQTYSWTIGATANGSTYKIKIIDIGDGSTDFSNADFRITQPVAVTSPNGGEIWTKLNTYSITWTEGSGTSANIELWDNALNVMVHVIAVDVLSPWSWIIPPTIPIGANYRIKIIDNGDGSTDLSNADFIIIDQIIPITLTSPNGGEIWATGSNHNLSWSGGSGTDTKIELWNTSTGLKVSDIATGIIGQTFSWTIGNIDPGSIYKIKVIDNDEGSTDLSDNNFSITLPVHVTSPDFPEIIWASGSTHNITWTGGSNNATIELLDYNVVPTTSYQLTSGTASPYIWSISASLPNGNQYKIKITDAGGFFDESDNCFTIDEFVHVTQPNTPNITFNVGLTYDITWNDNISDPVNIYLYKVSTATYLQLAANVIDGTNTYHWTVPNYLTLGSDYKIKVSSVADPAICDFSDFEFTIGNGSSYYEIEILQPSAPGVIWTSGEDYLISWIDNLSLPVKIELINYTTNTLTTLAESVSGSTFPWHINEATPDGVQYKILISSVTGNGTIDLSDNYFVITDTPATANIIIEQPTNTGITWLRGSTYLISWTDNVPDNNVDIILCNGVGSEIATLRTDAPGSTWSWTVPPTTYPVGEYKIKVVYNDASGISLHAFTISDSPAGAYIDLLQPNAAGITWLRGSSYLISWEDNLPGNVDIYYERTSDPTEVPVATNISGSVYGWTIPSSITEASDYWITIRSHSDASIVGISENPFAILDYLPGGFIDVIQPDGGEIWTKGNSYLISWDNNFAENVKVELVNYATSATIVLNASSSGSTWGWTIPNTNDYPAGVLYKMKISSTENPALFAESNNYFTINNPAMTAFVYPNPANLNLTIQFSEELSGDYTLSLSNRFNMQVMTKTINVDGVKELTVSSFGIPNGVYILTITSENLITTKKVIIQH